MEIPAGWKLAKGVDAPTSVVITQDDDTPITIALDKIVKPDSGKPTGGDKHEGGKPGTGQQGGNHNEGAPAVKVQVNNQVVVQLVTKALATQAKAISAAALLVP